MEIWKKKERPWIFLALGLSFVFLLAGRFLPGSSANHRFVVVSVLGNEIDRVSLAGDEGVILREFSFEYAGETYQGTLEMQKNRVRLQRLPRDISPLSIHADTGWISEPYQLIVCLPVGLVVRIEGQTGDQSQYQVDVVSGPGRMVSPPVPPLE